MPAREKSTSHANDDGDASAQLNANLQSSIPSAPLNRRPILTHLNADTSWLLSTPYPESHLSSTGNLYFHILIDPWFRGSQSDVAKFFSEQWHKEPSAVQTLADLEEVVKRIEKGASEGDQKPVAEEDTAIVVDTGNEDVGSTGEVKVHKNWIDAIIVSHEFTDHMHKATLLEMPASVPVFATAVAGSKIRAWKHFSSVLDIDRFAGDWRDNAKDLLPSWLGISRIAFAGKDMLYYHAAVMVAFTSGGSSNEAEAVIYTPHGISPEVAAPIPGANPKIKTLALLHGLQDISLPAGAQLNLGAFNGLKVQRLLDAKYWIGTHDEIKKGGGIVSWFLRRKIITLKDAIERERAQRVGKNADVDVMANVRFEELGNGQSLHLE